MIIRSRNDRVLNTNHVVEWLVFTEGEGENQRHTVTAKTILDTSVEIFEGTQAECETRLDAIYINLDEEVKSLYHLSNVLAKRDDRLTSAIKRLAATIK